MMQHNALELLLRQDSCVLATCGNGMPHASLMAFAADADGAAVYMATSANTRKHANIQANPMVSLLVDNRGEHPGAIHERALALTLHGAAEIITDPAGRDRARGLLLERIPALESFLREPSTRFIRVTIRDIHLVAGPAA